MNNLNKTAMQTKFIFVLIYNRSIIGRLLGADYRPTNNPPLPYRCISTKNHTTNQAVLN